MKWLKKRKQSNVSQNMGDHSCKYCGRSLPASALKRRGAFFSCVDLEDCLAYQNENDNAKQNDGGSNAHINEAPTSEAIYDGQEALLNGEEELSSEAEETEAYFLNPAELLDTPELENDEMQKDYTDKINDAISNLQNVFDHELREMEDRLKERSGDVHEKVQERKRLARELKLDKKLIEIYEEIDPYPHWSKRKDWHTYRNFEIEDPQSSKAEHEQTISFCFRGKRYCFKYLDKGSSTDFEGEYFHHTRLTLQDNSGKKLIEISISVEYDYVAVLEPFDITAFVPGDWMKDFLEGYEQMKFIKKKKETQRKYDVDKVNALKQNFGIE